MNFVNNIVDRQHVSASNIDVLRAVRRALQLEARIRKHRKGRHQLYRAALRRHTKNRKLFMYVARGGY